MNKFRKRTIVLAIAPLIALVAGSRFALAKVTSGPVHFGYVDEITSVHELCGEADIDVSGGYGWGSSRSWVRPHYSDCVGSEYGESFPASWIGASVAVVRNGVECAAAEPPNYNYNGGPVYAGAFNVCPDPGGAIWHSVASHRWWDLSRGGVYAGVTHNSPNLGPTLGAIAVTKGQPKPRFGRIPEAAFLPNGQTDLALVPEYVGVSTIINGKDVVVGYVTRESIFNPDPSIVPPTALPTPEAAHRSGAVQKLPPVPGPPDHNANRQTVFDGPALTIVGYMYPLIGFISKSVAENKSFDPTRLIEARKAETKKLLAK